MKGAVRVRIAGLSAEKLLNAARAQGIRLRRVRRRKDRSLTAECPRAQEAALRALAEEKGFSLSPAEPVGLTRALACLAARPGLIAGAAAGMALLFFASGFVWQVRVENAGAYEGEVRAFLTEMGVYPGVRRARVDLNALREKLEWRLPRVQWVRAEWTGAALTVRLEEGVPPPDVETAGRPGDVVAAEDGLLLRLTVYAGTPAAKAGDFVRAGQTLIRGEERGENGETVAVKARGEAVARVWVAVKRRLPVWEWRSIPTGRVFRRQTFSTPFFSFSPDQMQEYLTADREKRIVRLCGAWLPVTAEKETVSEVFLEKAPRDAEAVKREGAEAAYLALRQALIADEIVDKWINFSMIEGDTMTVTATAEVRRDIARYRPCDGGG